MIQERQVGKEIVGLSAEVEGLAKAQVAYMEE